VKYIGLAFSASMLPHGTVQLTKTDLTPKQVRAEVDSGNLVSCCNPYHTATLAMLSEKHGINVDIPPEPPRIDLSLGDSIIVMQASGVPRRTDRLEYTREEIDAASFCFMFIEVNP
jgi:hypothetical protein